MFIRNLASLIAKNKGISGLILLTMLFISALVQQCDYLLVRVLATFVTYSIGCLPVLALLFPDVRQVWEKANELGFLDRVEHGLKIEGTVMQSSSGYYYNLCIIYDGPNMQYRHIDTKGFEKYTKSSDNIPSQIIPGTYTWNFESPEKKYDVEMLFQIHGVPGNLVVKVKVKDR